MAASLVCALSMCAMQLNYMKAVTLSRHGLRYHKPFVFFQMVETVNLT